MCNLLDGLVALGCIMLRGMLKDMGQRMGYRCLEWNWPKEAMNRPIWASIVDGAKMFPALSASSADDMITWGGTLMI